ncbi:MAG: hypothetical protein QXN97_04750 [Desulfurococcaceae archaeon]
MPAIRYFYGLMRIGLLGLGLVVLWYYSGLLSAFIRDKKATVNTGSL